MTYIIDNGVRREATKQEEAEMKNLHWEMLQADSE